MNQSSHQYEELLALCWACQAGELSDEEAKRLEKMVLKDDAACTIFIRYSALCANLEWEGVIEPGPLGRPVGYDPLPKADLIELKKRGRQKQRKALGDFSQVLLICMPAILLISIGLFLYLGLFNKKEPIKKIANVNPPANNTTSTSGKAYIVNAIDTRWKQGEKNWERGDTIHSGNEAHLEQGLVELSFPTGVKVIVTAPATFQITGKNKIALSHGTLVANVTNKKGKGFTVKTPTMKIVDLGTRFGVHVNKKGGSEIHVFKGIVDCFAVKGKEIDVYPKRLTAGKSLKRQAGGEFVQSDAKSDELFAACLRQQAGIKSLSGDLKFLPQMPASLGNCDFTSNDYIHLFAEQQDLILPQDITCSVPKQNRKGGINEKQFKPGIVKKGTKVSIYYVHFDAHCPGHPNFSSQTVTAKGTLNFSNEILGILKTDVKLKETDRLLGNIETRYTSSNEKTNRGANDPIGLTPDNRGLNLNWNLARENIIGSDCIRVIVAAQK